MIPPSESLRAHVRFVPESEGGIQDGFDGMRPSFEVDGELVLCIVKSLDGQMSMPRGGSYQVEISFPYHLGKYPFPMGKTFTLRIGSATIATGTVL